MQGRTGRHQICKPTAPSRAAGWPLVQEDGLLPQQTGSPQAVRGDSEALDTGLAWAKVPLVCGCAGHWTGPSPLPPPPPWGTDSSPNKYDQDPLVSRELSVLFPCSDTQYWSCEIPLALP